jgi:hypothetical protein
VTVPLLLSLGEGLSVGRDPGSPVSKLYPPPFEFTGTIFKVTADVSGKDDPGHRGGTEGDGESAHGAAIRKRDFLSRTQEDYEAQMKVPLVKQ